MKVSKVLEIAKEEVGYLEKANANNLDNKTANAGNNNYTKYSRDLVKLIGSPYAQGVAWCDMFADWCYIKASDTIENAYKTLNGWSAYTPSSANNYKKDNRWYTSPKVGDQIFFKNSQRICHTGIVIAVDDTYVYTIEGNTSDGNTVIANGGAVCQKKYKLGYSSIAGYGRPIYEDETETEATSTTEKESNNMTYGVDVAKWNGTIDWKKVVASGKDFAILKITKKDNNIENSFKTNYTNAVKNGMRVLGVYRYVYATTKEEAINEANAMIMVMASLGITPSDMNGGIWLDMEDKSIKSLGKAKLTEIIMAEAFILRAKGYAVGIYCNKDWYQNVLDSKTLCNNKFPFWIARYPSSDNGTIKDSLNPQSLNKERVMAWQYSSKGTVNGITTNCDLDLCYYKLDDVMALYK